MKVVKQQATLVDFMGTDLSVVNAARVSFDKQSEWDWAEINGSDEPVLSDKDKKLIKYLAKHNHWSPFSHAVASFRVKAPIFVARQLAKHQVGFSWNETSRRYVDSEPEFYIPEVWRKRAENVKQGSSNVPVDVEIRAKDYSENIPYDAVEIAYEAYTRILALGVCPEQARMVLPQNTMTEWIWTGSLYGWARMCKLRLDPHTQLETQEIATYISEQLKEIFPVSWPVLMEN